MRRSQDAVGIALSGLCLVHCLALPFVISLGPALVWMEDERIHLALAGLALLVSLNAMRSWPGGMRVVTVVGASGLALSHGAAWLASAGRPAHRH
jgi:hypothetical protein